MTKLRILLVDDHTILRAGLKLLINGQADMVVVGEAGNGQEAIRQTKEHKPDIIVMDISLPDLSGAEATEQIKHAYAQVRVLALTRHSNQGYLRRLLRAGASGYVLKKTAADELLNAIRSVASGGTYLDPIVAREFVENFVGHSATVDAGHPLSELTEREVQVLHLIAWGHSNKEIGVRLGISVKTVEHHKANATEKLHLHSRTEILRYALAQGWLNDEEIEG